MYKLKSHKIAKGDTLVKLAKAHKIRKWQTIWEDPANRKLKSKRKKPESLAPGDVVVIPFNDQQRAEMSKQRQLLLTRKAIDSGLTVLFTHQAKLLEASVQKFQKDRAKSLACFDTLIGQQKRAIKDLNTTINLVDKTAVALRFASGLTQLAVKYRGNLDKVEELAKIRKKGEKLMSTHAVKGMEHLTGEVRKEVYKYLEPYIPEFLKTFGDMNNLVNKSYDDIQKPSFWAGTVVSKMDGKTWSEATTRDYNHESEQRIARLARIQQSYKLMFDNAIKDFSKGAEIRRKLAKNAAVRIKLADKMLAQLPKL